MASRRSGMTEAEWLASEDPVAMLEEIRANWRGEEADLVRLTHRYLLACCRAIWTLLPMEASRRGVEVAERYIQGRATPDEFSQAEFQAEGAAFFLDPFEWEPDEEDPEAKGIRLRYEAERKERIEPLVRAVEALPAEEICRMVRTTGDEFDLAPRQLLADAAYFADFAMVYPGVKPTEGAVKRHAHFLSASLLRDQFGSLSGRGGIRTTERNSGE